MSVELLIAGVVLIVGGFLQIRVQRWSKNTPPVGDGEIASSSRGDERPGETDVSRGHRLWVAWTEVLGVISIVFGVVVLIVAFTR
jgi:uncharacterized membrane protein HdeD (DUF308 family)